MASAASPAVVVPEISRSDFPEDFIFGAGTSAVQVEGAAALDGRGPSIWDVFAVQKRANIKDGSNSNVAVDQYHRYKEDVSIMKKIGLDAYRLSISWSRVLPGGRLSAGVNKQGVQYYNNLINELLKNGIEPYVTLFHWDVPQSLEAEYGGFLNKKIIEDFCEFADLCFWEFGDRVKNWITLNEPWSFASLGYAGGGLAPGRGVVASDGLSEHLKHEVPKSRVHRISIYSNDENIGDPGTEPYIVAHNLILAHGAAAKLYREQYKSQGGRIGITLVSEWWEPLNNTAEDQEACERMIDFFLGWFIAPITYGEYPKRMRDIVKERLPRFTKEESHLIKMSYDFLGLNYYTCRYAQDISDEQITIVSYNTDSMVKTQVTDLDGKLIGPAAGSQWLHVYPPGIYELLVYVKDRYNDPLIYITENGIDEPNDIKLTLPDARQDPQRVRYIHDHLQQIKRAMDENVNVGGYFVWSFIDNYEWQLGYTVRYGIIYVDYWNDLARYPKLSALWYMNFINSGNGGLLPASEPEKIPTPASTKKRPNSYDGNESAGRKSGKRKAIHRV